MIRPALLLTLLIATPLAAQTMGRCAPPPDGTPQAFVALTTPQGRITLALETKRAPLTAANFLRYVDQKRYDGASFYRAMKIGPEAVGLIQGGFRQDGRRMLAPIAHEPTSKTGLTHCDGAISMARAAPGSARSEFFIIVEGIPSLDAAPQAMGDNAGFAVFGRVVDGMDVVRRIQAAKTDPSAGEGAMRGQMIAAPVAILSARRVKPPAPPAPPAAPPPAAPAAPAPPPADHAPPPPAPAPAPVPN
ncbi:peptidylprolyl isomerase [Sandaracinobacteroides saxicola]|uniref:peptidylprolyl isomerase n=1 Tax=Sandaracinobacteroides saxicola TaxID=2759707 RepID=A0A7G5IEA5_9SPHN|nr:peptidylprolyl isomerase [Sandaracinobacteroides saxicola]QMW21697.1 peptidylprolyl isomerase [Sandaracinobacteroides saxicola]